jgi:anti-sigma B factor antagonist
MLEINIRNNGNTTILDLDGNVIMGGGSAKLRETINKILDEDKTEILLNFANVKYLDSSGTGEILAFSRKISDLGGCLKLSNLTPKVREVLALSSILPILDIYEDESKALDDEDSQTSSSSSSGA